ncbi:MAG: chemotaxis protein CheW [Giesbergeria sp.]|nr:chemotaxis protein CheW [Giesbergeria sp.]MBP6419548.1 chemotaxis protein CheW [Giesbergeria sp.]
MHSDNSKGAIPPVVASKGSASTTATAEYLTFQLGKEEYGIDILKVQEIRSYEQPTRMAQAPDFIKGIIDLRGVIVPIIDLRLKLQCAQAEYTDFTVVIILNVRGTVMGVVVDAVADVVALTREAIKPAPQFQSQLDAAFVTGIARMGDRMLIMMDIESLLDSAEMGLVAQIARH